eukprot:COSAG01_NODE_5154_length_4449_cov_2.393333_3_plen_80_part_00
MWPRLLAEGEDEEAVDGTRLPLNPASGIMSGGTAQLTDEPLVAFARAATPTLRGRRPRPSAQPPSGSAHSWVMKFMTIV